MPIPFKERQRGYAHLRQLAEQTLQAYRELNSAAALYLTEGNSPRNSVPRIVELLGGVLDEVERPRTSESSRPEERPA